MPKPSRRHRSSKGCSHLSLTSEERSAIVNHILGKLSESGLDAAKEPGLLEFLKVCRQYKATGERTEFKIRVNNGKHNLEGTLPRKRADPPSLCIRAVKNS